MTTRIGQLTVRQSETLTNAYAAASVVGTAAGAYHGYRRTGSVGWAIGWAVMGALFPIVTIPVALAQGFGKRA